MKLFLQWLFCTLLFFSATHFAQGQEARKARRNDARKQVKNGAPTTTKPIVIYSGEKPKKENKKISGKILMDPERVPLEGAAVSSPQWKVGGYTDSLGVFYLELPPQANTDSVEIVINAVGFEEQKLTLPMGAVGLAVVMREKEINVGETVIITASRIEQKLQDAPVTIHVVKAVEIQRKGYKSLRDLLADNVEYKVDNMSDASTYNSITTRGVRGQDNFIILLDGVRISSPTNEPMPIMENYPLHLAKQVEIVTSAASALYGADALCGVINIISYRPDEINGGSLNVSGGLYNQYFGNLLFGKQFGKVGLRLAGQVMYDKMPNLSKFYAKEFAGIDSLKSGVFNSAFGPISAKGRVEPEFDISQLAYAVEGTLTFDKLTLSVFANYAKTSTATPYTPNDAVYNSDAYLGQGILKASLQYNRDFGKLNSLTLLNVSSYRMNPQSSYRNTYSGFDYGYKFSQGSMWQAEQQFTYSFGQKLKLTAGVSFQQFSSIPRSDDLDRPVQPGKNYLEANILGTPFKANFFAVSYWNLGTYAQAIYKPAKQWTLTAGVRYDYNSRYDATVNPRAGVVFNPTDKTSIKLFYGSAFLAPSPYTSYYHFGSFFSTNEGQSYQSFFWRLPNPGLQPIISHNIDLNFEQKIGDFRLSLTPYVNFLSNLHVAVNDAEYLNLYKGQYLGWPVDYIEVVINTGRQINWGGMLNVAYRASLGQNWRINLVAGVGYHDGIQDILGKKAEIPFVSPFQFRFNGDVYFKKFFLAPRLMAMTNQRTLALDADNRRVTLPGYVTLSARLGYEPTKWLQVYADFDNITDARYLNVNTLAYITPTELQGMPQTPFRFSAGARFTLDWK